MCRWWRDTSADAERPGFAAGPQKKRGRGSPGAARPRSFSEIEILERARMEAGIVERQLRLRPANADFRDHDFIAGTRIANRRIIVLAVARFYLYRDFQRFLAVHDRDFRV